MRVTAMPVWGLLLLASVAGISHAQESGAPDVSQVVDAARLEAHVRYLASNELAGRRDGPGLEKARAYVLENLREAGLRPAGTDGFVQSFGEGQNLIGLLPGGHPTLQREYVVIGAHYDHLGRAGERIYPGANDNATGVAAMLEVARALGRRDARPHRSLLFVAFDQEEPGLIGSRHFVAHPTISLDDVAVYVNLDMLGRNMGDVIDDYVFVLGSEHSPMLEEVVLRAGRGLGIRPGLVGTDLIGIRGDYAPFQRRRIPFLFFSNGVHPDYHRPTDTADRILYPKLHATTQLVLRTVLALGDLSRRPRFGDPRPSMHEARVFADAIGQLIPKAEMFGVGGPDMAVMVFLRDAAQDVVERGEITPAQRELLKRGVQGLLVNLEKMLRSFGR